ncbi:MAG: glycosyl hydrolase [Saprospiraceae bacterium]|nr:glycosyl hydrolase [Saprospiraceae bacterium]MBP7679637.1 glycosyl hydrolase [Saprospiraceae bacterium]
MQYKIKPILAFCVTLFLSTFIVAQTGIDPKVYSAVKWRNIGPYRGGRSAAVVGVPNKPLLYYMGATGGGVWRTTDGGARWQNISDSYFGGSIGAVSVSTSDNNIIYVGGGESTLRGNVSSGNGVWKTDDNGTTWKFVGLEKTRHIARIRIHPQTPDIVYVAAMGDAFKDNAERGIYRTTDGGKTWEKILFINDAVGAADLCFDPTNPRILYATMWRFRRTPYSFSSGGDGCSIWKTTDGGATWKELTNNEGLPKGIKGIITVSASPVKPERVWAMVESENGGLFRSDNGGATWKRTNEERKLRQRAWYFSRVEADTKNADVVYVLNVEFHKSSDGGVTFKEINTPHGDHHDIWIAPEDANRMVIGDDGGAQITYDGGDNWSTYMNQPTAQFYRLTTDNYYPYRIYVAQQDNSTLRITHTSYGGERDWEVTAGGESAHIAVDPLNYDIVYAGSYGGYLTRKDHITKQERAINPYPDNPIGHGAEDCLYRFQWNFPIFFSPHNKKKLYACSNNLHVTYNEGQSWEVISPDLTRNDSSKLKASGGPITKDNTGVEVYCTIFAAAEAPNEEGVIWTGSDDGLLYITKDSGKTWTNITPKNDFPEWLMINCIDLDTQHKGWAYIAATAYKSGDNKPYLYRTKDYGKTWKKIVSGIADNHFTRAIRSDSDREGLLYAGTENGMYLSWDDGDHWERFQLNMPQVPITDLLVKDKNLIASTQGRGIWIIDNLTVLHQSKNELANKPFHLYQPQNVYRGEPVETFFYINKVDSTANITLEYLSDTTVIKTFAVKAKKDKDKFTVKDSCNLFRWNTTYDGAKSFDGMVLWWGSLSGPQALPGNYRVRLSINGETQEQSFAILKNPMSQATDADLKAQFDFTQEVNKKLSETHTAITDIRDVQQQLQLWKARAKEDTTLQIIVERATAIDSVMTNIEETLYQTKNRSGQDPINFPIRLNNKLAHLNAITRYGDYPPTDQAVLYKNDFIRDIDAVLAKWKNLLQSDIPAFNALIREKALDAIQLKKAE